MGDFKKLEVWQTAHELALEIYRATASFPRSEAYGLTSQMRRSAGSIAANIAEGCGRNTDGELARFARISLGSAAELESHLLLASDLNFLDPTTTTRLATHLRRIQKMLGRLLTVVRQSSRPRPIADS
ncbi:MAG: four helix bundle protein [Gemmatimonadales bacterium]|nr:four helix bundle protein [Gemmatimonadales bacterium]